VWNQPVLRRGDDVVMDVLRAAPAKPQVPEVTSSKDAWDDVVFDWAEVRALASGMACPYQGACPF
jgi:hypothetical protein